MGNLVSLVGETIADYFDAEGPGVRYRTKAKAEAGKRAEILDQSRMAYAEGRRAEAKQLSEQGKIHTRNMERYNAWAADAIFAHHNPEAGRQLDTIDLHGLYVNEALARAEQHILACKKAGVKRTVFITGKGKHSRDGLAKLKPSIEGFLRRENLRIFLDMPNAGCITVEDLPLDDPRGCTIM